MYFAHSAVSGKWHPLKDHLLGVGELAAKFAAGFDAAEEARLAGLLHDLGKYGQKFQDRLKDPKHVTGIDHWTMGAWAALYDYKPKAVAAGLAAAGHHLGLTAFDRATLKHLNPDKYQPEGGRRLSEADKATLLARLGADGISLPEAKAFSGEITVPGVREPAAVMADYRMLYSALVDADFLDTEAHFSRGPDGVKRLRPPGPPLEPEWALGVLLAHIKELAAGSTSAAWVNAMRADLLSACLQAASQKPGQFTLSAPTGAGKTLAMLAFALKHAQEHSLRRVVMVIPYLSIIEQSAQVFRQVFAAKLPPETGVEHYILEHHSNAGIRGRLGLEDGMSPSERRRRQLCQNWDAPIIITTSVQMLESLFANRPGPCRKLHRLAGSVILFDEVQTLPMDLAATTLAGLARLCSRFKASVVFSTATQPAFGALNQKVKGLGGEPWQPREIAAPSLGLFSRAKRVEVTWPSGDERLSPAQVAAELAGHDNRRSLCVVNLKRQTRAILQELMAAGSAGLFHLSTSMCPLHRQEVLKQVRRRLDDPAGPPVRLVSTQCVEAGVDLDFPVVYRAWGPLTAIAQAAGRCNRNGKLGFGRMRVFHLREEHPETGRVMNPYPEPSYGQAAGVAKAVFGELGPDKMDLDDPGVYERFYGLLYQVGGTAQGRNKLEDAVGLRNFAETARLYRLIKQDAINVLVPYDMGVYEDLASQAREEGLSRQWIIKARQFCVGVFRPQGDSAVLDALEPIPMLGQRGGAMSEDWFICPPEGFYSQVMGFALPDQMGLLEV